MTTCLFCRIIKGEIPSKKVYEDGQVYAFSDINPKAPVHVLVVPKKHISSLSDVSSGDKNLLGCIMLSVKKIAGMMKIDKSGYKIVVNNGKGAGQVIFHLHLHLMGGWKRENGWDV
jgi:histidine triad (HIT) family protein